MNQSKSKKLIQIGDLCEEDKAKINRIVERLVSLGNENEAMSHRNEEILLQNKELKDKLDPTVRLLAQYQERLSLLTDKISVLVTEHETVLAREAHSNAIVLQLEAQIQQLDALVSKQKALIDKHATSQNKLNEAIDAGKQQILSYDSEKLRLQSTVSELQDHISNADKRYKKLEDGCFQVTKQLTECQQALVEKDKKCNELHDKLFDTLSQQIKAAQIINEKNFNYFNHSSSSSSSNSNNNSSSSSSSGNNDANASNASSSSQVAADSCADGNDADIDDSEAIISSSSYSLLPPPPLNVSNSDYTVVLRQQHHQHDHDSVLHNSISSQNDMDGGSNRVGSSGIIGSNSTRRNASDHGVNSWRNGNYSNSSPIRPVRNQLNRSTSSNGSSNGARVSQDWDPRHHVDSKYSKRTFPIVQPNNSANVASVSTSTKKAVVMRKKAVASAASSKKRSSKMQMEKVGYNEELFDVLEKMGIDISM